MLRVVLAVDPQLGVNGVSLIEAWQKDESATRIGNATVSHESPGGVRARRPRAGDHRPGGEYRQQRALRRHHTGGRLAAAPVGNERAVELVETEGEGDDRVIVVRLRP